MTWLDDAALGRLRGVFAESDADAARYEVLEEVGRGGMGTVYRARDRELGREVALKVLSAGMRDADAAERLRREARVLAALEHPGIVPVHDVGVLADGRVFYAMKLVRGERLDHHAARLALPERLRLFLRVCEAVSFAHAQGVVHRDLKPQNVMVGAFGEVLVLDWGVARVRAAADLPASEAVAPAGETAHGTVLGTPGYMAPEQERGEVDRVDARTDVYALGAILRFLAEPAPPKPLAAIAARATAAEPAARYPSAAELAADVSRWLDGLPVGAYRERWTERAARFVARHHVPILLVLTYLLMRILLLVFQRDGE